MTIPINEKLQDGMWLSLENACQLEGCSLRTLQRRISTVDFPKDKVRWVDAGQAGKRREILLSALPPEAQAKWYASHQEEEVLTLTALETDRQSEGPLTRMRSADPDEKARGAKVARWVEEFNALPTKREKRAYAAKHHLSLRTLYHWARMARLGGTEPKASIYIRRPAAKPVGWRAGQEAVQRAVSLYLQRTAPNIHQVYGLICQEFASPPSLATLYRWLSNDDLVPPAMATMARKGMRAYRDKSEGILLRDWSQEPVNGCWMGDHHELDLFVVSPEGRIVRPWMTSWLDGHSRLTIGYYLSEGPNADTIALALRHGILPKEDGAPGYGVPQSVLCDNGKDYKSHHLNGEVTCCWKQTEDLPVFGLFAELNIRRRWTKPYSARSKAPKERSYGTLERKYLSQLPGYCGSCPKERPENLQADVLATRKWLETEGAEGECRLLRWWQFEEVLGRVISAYNSAPHSALDGRSPAQAWEEDRPAALPVPKADTLDYLVERSAARKVHNKGILLTYTQAPKQACVYHDPALFGLVGQTVEVRYSPFRRDSILVISKGEVVCRASRHDDAAPFAETDEEKGRLAQWLEATSAQRKAFVAYLDGIQEASLQGFLRRVAPGRTATTLTLAHPKDRISRKAKATPETPATYPKLRAVGDLIHENGNPIRLWEHELKPSPQADRP